MSTVPQSVNGLPVWDIDEFEPIISGTQAFHDHFLYPEMVSAQLFDASVLIGGDENIYPDFGNANMFNVPVNTPQMTIPQTINQIQGVPQNIQGSIALAMLYAGLAQKEGKLPGSS